MSSYSLLFDHLLHYDAGKPGIAVPVLLQSGQFKVNVAAKLDTGPRTVFSSDLLGRV